jgi:hypothetical protein
MSKLRTGRHKPPAQKWIWTFGHRNLHSTRIMVYSNPNYTDLRVGKAKLDAEQRRINERQLEIEELKVRLSLLQERLAQRKHASKSPPRP